MLSVKAWDKVPNIMFRLYVLRSILIRFKDSVDTKTKKLMRSDIPTSKKKETVT